MKRFLTLSVVAATIAWSLGLAGLAPQASAAYSPADGDIIKVATNPAVYYITGGKRLLFSNRVTYGTWFADFSTLKVISQADFDAIPSGGNVTARPGVNLIKFDNSSTVYAVATGNKICKITSADAAKALYGDNWSASVVTIQVAFEGNYTVDATCELTATSKYPAGSLIKASGSSDIYYWDGTSRRLVSTEAFIANGFKQSLVKTVADVTTYGTLGAALTAKEAAIAAPSAAAGSTTPVTGGSVTVSLASDSPVAKSVPQTVGRVPFTKVNLTASASGAATVESITVKRSGLTGSYSEIAKVWAESNGVAVTSKRALNSNDEVILTFAPVLTIAAGQSVALEIAAELVSANGNGALGVIAVNEAAVTPVVGNLMTFVAYSVTQLTFAQPSPVTSTPGVGENEVELGRFSINFGTTTQRDVVVTSVTLRNTGSEDLAATLMNVYLESMGEKVSEYATISGRSLTFTFNGGLEMLKDDGDKTFVIKGDVIGRDGNGDLVLTLNKKEDLVAKEKATGFGIAPGHADGVAVNAVNIASGVVTVAKKSTSPSDTSVVASTPGVLALLANIKADQAINADGLKVQYITTDATSFGNVKVYVNNVLLGSFDVVTSTPAATSYTVDSSLSLKKGDNEVKVTVDVKSLASSTATFKANLVGGSGALLDMPEYVANGNTVATSDISGSANGALLTVDAGSLTFTRNDGYANDRPVVQNTSGSVLGKFAIKANNDAIRINNITLGANGASGTKITDGYISDMELYVDGVKLGTTKDFSGGANFSSLNYQIAKDATKVLELRGSFGSATGTFETLVTLNAQNSAGRAIDPKTASTTRISVVESGALAGEALTTPSATIIVSNAGEQEVAKYRLTATRDLAKVTEITLTNVGTTTPTSTAVTDPRISSYKMYVGSELVAQATPVSGVATFAVSGDKLVVAANTNKTIVVKAVLNPITVEAETNKPLTLRLTEIKAKGSSGSDITPTISTTANSQTMYIRSAKPILAKQASVRGQGDQEEVARFTITASGGDIQVVSTTFTRVGTGAASTSDFRLVRLDTGDTVATSSDAVFGGFELNIEEGATVTMVVRANTASVANELTFGLSLSDDATVNKIAWNEYFIESTPNWVGAYTSAHLWEIPLSFGTVKY